MPRSARIAPGGMVFHALNRRVERRTLFHYEADYFVYEDVLRETLALSEMRLCAYCLMPTHWHMVLWPRCDGEMSQFLHRLSGTHAANWKARHGTTGEGHLYQNRFKSFPVQSDAHYFRVVRYVERNALRANLVQRAEDWRYSSLWRRERSLENDELLSAGPVSLPVDWIHRVNQPETAAELEALRGSVRRGNPYGAERWRQQTAHELGLESSLRPRGRPKKSSI
jgi:putative transposase